MENASHKYRMMKVGNTTIGLAMQLVLEAADELQILYAEEILESGLHYIQQNMSVAGNWTPDLFTKYPMEKDN